MAFGQSAHFKDVPANEALEGGTCAPQHFMSPIGALRYTCKGGQISIYILLGVRAIRALKMSTWRKCWRKMGSMEVTSGSADSTKWGGLIIGIAGHLTREG